MLFCVTHPIVQGTQLADDEEYRYVCLTKGRHLNKKKPLNSGIARINKTPTPNSGKCTVYFMVVRQFTRLNLIKKTVLKIRSRVNQCVSNSTYKTDNLSPVKPLSGTQQSGLI